VSVNPKETLKTILEEIILVKDDGSTPVSLKISDEFTEQAWENFDIVFTVALASEQHKFITLRGETEIVANYRIGIWTRNREGVSGLRLLWDAEKEVKRVIGKYAKAPGGILRWMRVISIIEAHRIEPRPVLYHADVTVETHRYVSMGGA
jgi:hypothetical protein